MPPQAATASDNKPVLIMSIWCTSYASAIILYRCTGRWRRTERFWIEDAIILLSILVLVARMVLVHFVLTYGTNNVDPISLDGDDDVRRRELGSQLALVCRLLYTTFLWMLKLSSGIYIARLTDQFWASKSVTSSTSGGRALKAFLSRYLNILFYVFLGLSYLAVVISEAAECRPFYQYWQVIPTPALACRVAQANLFTMGILDVLTNLTLVALPLPMILSAKLATKVKIETFLLMLFPLVGVAFTCYRAPAIYAAEGSQRYRTLLASIDILLSTASANALVIISFLKDRGFKKLKYRHEDEDEEGPLEHVTTSAVELESMDRPVHAPHNAGLFGKRKSPVVPLRRPTWGSDEDLMRDDSDGGGGPSTHTTSEGDVENERPDATGQSPVILVMNNTGCLSPALQVETNVMAARVAESEGRRRTISGPAGPPPCRNGVCPGIVVETSWKVDISQK